MHSILRNDCGRPTIEVEFDPNQLTDAEAMRAAMRAHGFRPGQVHVIAMPKPYPVIGGST
jgi:hypothetical protein